MTSYELHELNCQHSLWKLYKTELTSELKKAKRATTSTPYAKHQNKCIQELLIQARLLVGRECEKNRKQAKFLLNKRHFCYFS